MHTTIKNDLGNDEPIRDDVFKFNGHILLSYNGTFESIKLPSFCTDIGSDSFKNCEVISMIMLGKNTFRIGNHAFANCSNLTTVKNTGKLERIEDYAFENCTSLVTIELPPTVRYIGHGAFKGCINLCEIKGYFDPNLLTEDVFEGTCPKLINPIYDNESIEVYDSTMNNVVFIDKKAVTKTILQTSSIDISLNEPAIEKNNKIQETNNFDNSEEAFENDTANENNTANEHKKKGFFTGFFRRT